MLAFVTASPDFRNGAPQLFGASLAQAVLPHCAALRTISRGASLADALMLLSEGRYESPPPWSRPDPEISRPNPDSDPNPDPDLTLPPWDPREPTPTLTPHPSTPSPRRPLSYCSPERRALP